MRNFIFIGFGLVGFGLMEVFNREKIYTKDKFIVVEPRDIEENGRLAVFKGRGVEWFRHALTKENYKTLLDPFCNKEAIIINVSVNVDSIMILEYCKKRGCFYIDTSTENYQDRNTFSDKYDEFKQDTLYYRLRLANKLIGKGKHDRTRIMNQGFNPGIINDYSKLGLKDYARKHRPELVKEGVWKGDYAKLGHDLGLLEVLVVEFDSQKVTEEIKKAYHKDCFYNTWSPIGYQDEAGDYIMLSLNNEDLLQYEKDGIKLIKPTDGPQDTHIRFIHERGMNGFRKCTTLDHNGKEFEYEGRLIPHMEIASLSDFYHYRGKDGEDAPTIMYVYSSSAISQKCLEEFKKNDYKELPHDYGLWAKDILPGGYDSIGARLRFKNGDIWWCGSVVDTHDAKKLGLKSGATVCQIAGAMYPAIEWMLKNPNEGLLNPEELPHKKIFGLAKPYMGSQYSKPIHG
jgi:homospermidine synthase